MILLEDLKKLTEKLMETTILKDVNSLEISLKVDEWNVRSLDNELFRLTGKQEDEHQECKTVKLTMSGVNYTISA